jgi:uncharacterized membrane protein
MSGKSFKDYSQTVTHGSVAQMFAVAAGVLLTVVGVAGLVVNADFSTGASLTAEKMLFLDVNGWSSVLYLLTGIILLVVAGNAVRAKQVSVVIGALYVVLTIWSLFDSSILGMLPVNDPTAILYAAIGVVGLTAGLGPDRSDSTT